MVDERDARQRVCDQGVLGPNFRHRAPLDLSIVERLATTGITIKKEDFLRLVPEASSEGFDGLKPLVPLRDEAGNVVGSAELTVGEGPNGSLVVVARCRARESDFTIPGASYDEIALGVDPFRRFSDVYPALQHFPIGPLLAEPNEAGEDLPPPRSTPAPGESRSQFRARLGRERSRENVRRRPPRRLP